MQQNQDTGNLVKLYAKLFNVKKEMGILKKDSNNPFFKSKYADLNAHLSMIEPLLQKNGLVLTQPVVVGGQLGNCVKTEITDIETGAQIDSVMLIGNIAKMQDAGSAITYARRYTLGSLFGMQAEDDDGNAVSLPPTKPQAKTVNKKADF